MLSPAGIFRILSIVLGLLIAFFTYDIYRKTKGGSKGWKYIAVVGLTLCAWAIFQVTFSGVIDLKIVRVITGVPLMFIIGIISPICPIFLVEDMGLRKPKWFNVKNLTYLYFIGFSLFFIYNFLTPFYDIGSELLSIELGMLSLWYVFTGIGYYYLWKGTKTKIWMIITISSFLSVIGTGLPLYSGACCGPGEVLSGQELCVNYPYDYVSISPLPCFPEFYQFALTSIIFLIIAEFLFVIGFSIFWKRMK